MTDLIAPSASIVTAYKAYANASAPSQATETASPDRFGPAVKTDTPRLSAATLGAMDQTEKEAGFVAYDKAGNGIKTGA